RPSPRPTPVPYTTLFRSGGYVPRTLANTPAEPPKDYAPSVPGGVLSENYGFDQPKDTSPFNVYSQGMTRDDRDSLDVADADNDRSEEHTSELQSRENLVC